MMEEIEQKPSRALPIGVSAVLAVATFGVLFAIRGSGGGGTVTTTNTPTTETPTTTTPTDKDKPPENKEPVATTTPPATDKPPPAATPDAGKAAVATTPPPAATPDAGKPAAVAAATPDAGAAAKPATDTGSTLATLTFVVTPKEAAARADITVDKKPVLGDRFQVQKGDTPVKVVVKSTGYQPFEKEIVPKADQQVPIELKKVEAASTTPPTTTSKPPTTTSKPPATVTKPPPTTTSKPKPPKKPKVEL